MRLAGGKPTLILSEHRQALVAAVVHDLKLRRRRLQDRRHHNPRKPLQWLELLGHVFGDLHAGTGTSPVRGVKAHDVKGRHLHQDDETPTSRVGPFLAHVKRHEHGTAVRGDGVEWIGVARAVVELVKDEVPHLPAVAAAIGLSLVQSRAMHDEHVFRWGHPYPSGRDPAARADGWQGEIALKMRAALKRARG